MAQFSNISRSEFEQSLTQQNILPIQIVYAALTSGIIFFAIVISYLLSESHGRQPEGADILFLLSGVHGLMIVTVYSVAPVIFRKLLTANKKPEQPPVSTSVSTIMQKIVAAHIVRMALYEGVALYGLVICLLTVLWGQYPAHSEFLFNSLSAVLFLIMARTTFPTKDRLGSVYSQYFS